MSRRSPRPSLAILGLSLTGLLACEADVDDGAEADKTAILAELECPGPAPLRRLDRLEYDNTVRDLLGYEGGLASASFPADPVIDGFQNQAEGLTISPLLAEHYMRAAELLAEHALAELDALAPCSPGEDPSEQADCAAAFIASFGARAFRRPLDDEQLASFQATYTLGREQGGGFEEGLRWVIERMLQSPDFLYRLELVDPARSDGELAILDDWQIASRLSYFLWRSMPDAALFELAEAGALTGPDAEVVIEAEARRMLEDPRARATILDFHSQWLELRRLDEAQKSSVAYPEFNSYLAASMREETARFVEAVIFEGDGRLSTLLTSPEGSVDADLAALYGVAHSGGPGFESVSFDPEQRAGLLTQASVLTGLAKAEESSPVLRGRFVRERLLCGELSPPPPGVVPDLPDLEPGMTTRERYEQHVADPLCAGCHQLMDPIGFGFEHYDAIGRFRSEQDGLAVDASGEVLAVEQEFSFTGAPELAASLAELPQVRRCYARQWFRYAQGRRLDLSAEACTLDQLDEALLASEGDVRELLVALTLSEAFRFRTVDAGGAP